MNKYLLSILLTIPFCAAAQDVDESAMFGDPSTLVMDSSAFQKKATPATDSVTGLKASGEVSATLSTSWDRAGLHHPLQDAPSYLAKSVGTIFLDARAANGTKAFAAIEGDYRADSTITHAYMRELFLDFNLHQQVYVRVGKQVLKWGRCYFWNPSDLINVEHKSFVARQGALEGTYGLRVHVPYKTRANFYGFLGSEQATTTAEIKGAAKAEILLGGTETALGIWKRAGLDPVYSWDISSGIHDWNLSGEAAFLPKGFANHYQVNHDTLWTLPNKAFTPQVAASIGRSFDFMQVQDRIMVQYEMYYNGLGYTKNPLSDSHMYPWKTALTLTDDQVTQLSQIGYPLPSNRLGYGPKALWLFANNEFSSYTLGRYYAAFFTSFSRFLVQDLTLSCNGLMNVTDGSYVVTGSLSYATLDNLTIQVMGITMGGAYPAEMTYSGNRLTIQGSANYNF